MSKKIPKLIIYGVTIIPITTVLACGESIDKLLMNEKSKQKDIITKIKSPTKYNKMHDTSLFDAINLARKKIIKEINNTKTAAEAIKVRKKGVIALNKSIKNYTDYLIEIDKTKFNSFKHLIVNKKIPILWDGSTTIGDLLALDGHDKIPTATNGVTRTFSVQTNKLTKVTTVTVTFTIGASSDTTTYKISGFKTRKISSQMAFMYQTKDGTIYIGNYNGLWRSKDNKWTHVVSIVDFFSGFMYQTKDGTIYVGTKDDGLMKIENNRLSSVDKTNVQAGFMYQTQDGIDGTIYVGTTHNGLMKLVDDGEGGKKLTLVDKTNVAAGVIYKTKDGTIYVGTHDLGLKKLVNDKLIDVVYNKIEFAFIYQTQDNTIYVGTSDEGLMKLVNDNKNGGKKLTLVDGTSVIGGFMHQTGNGTIYVGTHKKGLMKLVDDKENGGKKLTSIDKTDVGTGFMYQTQDGTIYVGTTRLGLKIFPKII